MVETILATATIIGGIGAMWFLWDKIVAFWKRLMRIADPASPPMEKCVNRNQEKSQSIGPPEIEFGDDADKMRTINGVRELTDSENELSLYNLPNGVYGWVEAYKLDSPQIWAPGSPFGTDFRVAPSDTQIRKHKKWHDDVELHKDRNGIVRILAFVNDSTRLQLQHPTRTDSVQLLMAFREYQEYKVATSLPRDRIEWFRHRNFGDGEPVADARVS